MHILQIGRLSWPDVVERWSKFEIRSTYVPAASLLSLLDDAVWPATHSVDGIALIATEEENKAPKAVADRFEPGDALELAKRLRSLPETVAMPDGRKWSAIPIFILGRMSGVILGPGVHVFSDGAASKAYFLPLDSVSNYGAEFISEKITAYRQTILSELDRLGFVVTYEAGRYRLGPALRPRSELSGHYYFGPADRRTDRVVTVDRDLLGVQLEIEQFEALINRPDVREKELQVFFEDHPHFLSLLAQPVPHVKLRDPAGKLLIPDLILKPLVAARRDSKWEVLELKLPGAKLTAGKGARRRLTHEVWKAISQLREYGSYFSDPRNEAEISAALGHALKRPKLAVLIGRNRNADVDALETQQAYLNDVRIVTYDEILEQQRVLLA